MGNENIDGRFAPPRSHVEDVAVRHEGLELAGRGSRFLAVIIDAIILFALFWLISKVTPWNPWRPANPSLLAFKPLEAIGSILLQLVPQAYFLATRGQSIGKILLKIRIVRSDGSPASLARLAGLRLALPGLLNIVPAVAMVFALFDVLAIFRQSRRCLHDLIADTIVVKA